MPDFTDAKSITEFAKKLKGKTLREACGDEIEKHNYSGKGNFGQILEKYYFGYEPNSDSDPDFKEAGLELKSSPLKTLKNGEIRSKERLVLNIINYMEVHKEQFDTSSFVKKNAHLLLVFYLHNREQDLLDYIIKLVDDWKFPEEDWVIIRQDWEIINQKIKEGKAHELSEGDTYYLGACTKGSTAAKSLRKQPFNSERAKQRAYSLKQGYVNHIIANLAQEESGIYGKILTPVVKKKSHVSIEDVVLRKFKPFYGWTASRIEKHFNLNLNAKSKSYFANLTNAVLGVELGKRIAEFEKADIQVKTVRLKSNDLPKEDISFPTFQYTALVETDWDEAPFKSILESKFFFVFYKIEGKKLTLKKVKFWNMPYQDIEEAKQVWEQMRATISQGLVVKEITPKGVRKNYFPKKKAHRVAHVRPHGRDKTDTYELPFKDKLTGLGEFTKQSFWLNASYVRDEIYLNSSERLD